MKGHPIRAPKQALLVMVFLAGTTACSKARATSEPSPVRPTSQVADQSGLDAGEPAIECPLAKQGVHPADLHPFKDVEKYIAFLERPDRAKWQRPDAIVAALGLAGNETVVDVGAGSGYFSFRLARALTRGTVVATDIQPEMVRHMHHKAMTEGVRNLQVVLGQAEEPGIPPAADLVFLCDVLHHVPNQAAWLGKLAHEMKSGARLALVEFKEGKLPQGPPEKLKLPRAKLMALAKNAGLVLDADKPNLLPYQTFLVFRKP
jgi:2-polyprenyl-3-methyl-5-hydroxy-6-metoxy-1,4-benzoquinol methylase